MLLNLEQDVEWLSSVLSDLVYKCYLEMALVYYDLLPRRLLSVSNLLESFTGMALLGCNVVSTDQTEVLPLLMRTVERNTSRIMQMNPGSGVL